VTLKQLDLVFLFEAHWVPARFEEIAYPLLITARRLTDASLPVADCDKTDAKSLCQLGLQQMKLQALLP